MHTQSIEIIAADKYPVCVAGFATLRKVENPFGPCEDARKNILPITECLPRSIREKLREQFKPMWLCCIRVHNLHQFSRLSHWQHFDHDNINQAEDRRVRANAESQREHGDGREAGVLAKLAGAE